MTRAAFVGGVLLALLLATALPAAGVSAPDDQSPPSDRYTTVEIDFGNADGDAVSMRVSYSVSYPARSEAEAARAQNETLDPPWYRGEERLQALARNYSSETVRPVSTRISYSDDDTEHGTIYLDSGMTVEGLFDDGRDSITLGEAIRDWVSHGDLVTIYTPSAWSKANASIEGGEVRGEKYVYRWAIGEAPELRFVLEESDVQEDELGSGPIVPLVAVLLAVALLARRG